MRIPQYIGRCAIAMNEQYNSFKLLSERTDRTKRAAVLQEMIVSEKKMNEVLKMHQKTTWHNDDRLYNNNNNLNAWISMVVMTDVLPVYSEKSISLIYNDEFDLEDIQSIRNFKAHFRVEFKELSEILLKAFGRRKVTKHKNYPSAGGLYPVIPILVVLDQNILEGIETPGSYIYNATDHELILLKEFTNQDVENLRKYISFSTVDNYKVFIAYSIDIKRSITKYRVRGYRHALIEVGLMAQSFRHSICEFERLGEVSWSGFSDNALTHSLGLNPRLAPVALLQWFGEKYDF